ncbi:MAG: hypothetical protein MIO92_09335 [Methanosarcinaceae archaeon]|nr:hypothetical protein [Methanosarcinaceae archaeon]
MSNNKEEKWQAMLKRIIEALSDLRVNHYIFNGFMEIVESNPDLPDNNLFIVWAWKNYLFAAAMGVRRQLSSKYDDVSLVNLLEDIKKEPAVLSRQRYTSLFKGTGFENDSHYVNNCFDEIVGKGKDFIDPTEVDSDIKSLNETAESLKVYATKTLAHAGNDAESIKTLPTIKDLDDSIDLFEKTLNKYYALLNAGGIELPKVAQVPWKEVFLKPWKIDKKNLV